MSDDGRYRTDDMVLATVLSAAGYRYQLEKFSSEKAVWAFICPEDMRGDFDDLCHDYSRFNASVEPRKFVAVWLDIRRELFALIPPPSARRAVASAS